MARSLVFSKITQALKGPSEDPDALQPGHMRLYSFYRPGLQAHRYGITAKQSIQGYYVDEDTSKVTTENLTVYNTDTSATNNGNSTGTVNMQEFNVVAPQFSLDPTLINTYYPPAGHQDEGRVLPHIVFNDPHVPWLRQAGISKWTQIALDTEDDPSGRSTSPSDNGRNLVPWMALLVFRPEELQVTPDEANNLKLSGMPSYNAVKLPANGAFPMTVGQYLSTISSRVYYEAGYQGDGLADFTNLETSTDATSIIFPTKTQLQSMFGTVTDSTPIQAQRFLAHVRQMNTIGFPNAGVEEEGYYSVVVSSMTGDLQETAPSTHVVHLVSIEHIDSTLSNNNSSFFSSNNSDRIGLVSLFSWTYTCIAKAISFVETMQTLATTAQPLRLPKEALEALMPNQNSNTDPLQANIALTLHDRLNSGYTIARWRVATGEETVAFNRGPLVPVLTEEVPGTSFKPSATRQWPPLSMTGKDYAIFDTSTGIMDSTYSSAWSLGKLMAISDSVFNAALMRYRSTIWSTASSATRLATNNVPARSAVLNNLAAAVNSAQNVTSGNFTGAASRINVPADQSPAPPVTDPSISDTFQQAIDYAVDHSATAASSGALYNGFDSAAGNNSDWEIILNWLHDVMYLAKIPAHLLFPEPSSLHNYNLTPIPADQTTLDSEALRFFYIDHAWIDCFIDGALSCANHLEPKYDYTRLRIKAVFNQFLATPIGTSTIKPPVPRYGFVLRSAVVKSTPDLRLTVSCWTLQTNASGSEKKWVEDSSRNPLVKYTKMDDFTILALVDCSPEEICLIKFAQPPHQQRFAFNVDDQLNPDIQLKKLYTDPSKAPQIDPNNPPVDSDDALEWKLLDGADQISQVQQQTFYSLNSRCIRAMEITIAATRQLLAKEGQTDPGAYTDIVPNACVFGIEMNDPSYQLEISGTAPQDTSGNWNFSEWTRSLWMGQTVTSTVSAKQAPVRAVNLKVSSAAATTPSVNTQRVAIQPHDPAQIPSSSPPSTFLNVSKAVSLTNAIVPIITGDPFVDSIGCQFELLVHPDYRPPPPRPIPALTGIVDNVYSPLDYLPTGTDYLYDLVFAVRRRNSLRTNLMLQSITIEIPVSDNGDKPDQYGNIREPLLVNTDYAGKGIQMCHNARFVPTLFSGPASTIGSPRWDNKVILGIKLIPRSGQETGTLALLNDTKAAEASVRLAEAPTIPIVDTNATAWIAQGVDHLTGLLPVNKRLPRGRCLIKMTETYGNNAPARYSWCVGLKVNGGDTDPFGNKM